MGQVYNALAGLGNVMERRGGIGPASIQAASVMNTLGRQAKADKRADELYALQKPALQLQSDEAQDKLAETGLNIRQILPKNMTMTSVTHFFAPRTDGSSLSGDVARQITNSKDAYWDKDGALYFAKDKPFNVPKWKLDKMIQKAGGAILAGTDPKKHLKDRIFENETALQGMDPKSPEYAALKTKIDTAKNALNDPTTMLQVYSEHADNLRQAQETARAAGASEKYVAHFDKAIARADAKYKAIYDNIKDKKEYDLKLRDTKAREKSAQASMIRAQKSGKTLNIKDLDAITARNVKWLATKYNLNVDPVSGDVTGMDQLSEEARNALSEEADRLNLDVGFTPQTETHWFSPDETTYTVGGVAGRPIVPGQTNPAARGPVAPVAQTLGPQQANPQAAKPAQPAIKTGPEAQSTAQNFIAQINSGAINPKQLLESLRQSGQNEVGRLVVQHMKSMATQGGGAGGQQGPAVANVKPIGQTQSGIAFGMSDNGYVVDRGGTWAVPNEAEMAEIQAQVQQSPMMGGTPVSMPAYSGPQGGYFNPALHLGHTGRR